MSAFLEADKLFTKFDSAAYDTNDKEAIKDCCMLCVDFLIRELKDLETPPEKEVYEYWNLVRTEITKL